MFTQIIDPTGNLFLTWLVAEKNPGLTVVPYRVPFLASMRSPTRLIANAVKREKNIVGAVCGEAESFPGTKPRMEKLKTVPVRDFHHQRASGCHGRPKEYSPELV